MLIRLHHCRCFETVKPHFPSIPFVLHATSNRVLQVFLASHDSLALARQADLVIAASESVKKTLVEDFGISDSKAVVVKEFLIPK